MKKTDAKQKVIKKKKEKKRKNSSEDQQTNKEMDFDNHTIPSNIYRSRSHDNLMVLHVHPYSNIADLQQNGSPIQKTKIKVSSPGKKKVFNVYRQNNHIYSKKEDWKYMKQLID